MLAMLLCMVWMEERVGVWCLKVVCRFVCFFFFGCVLGFLMKGEVDKREV